MKILLLDDDARDVPTIADVWRLRGHTVYQVFDWRKLDAELRNHEVDAMLIDLMIPAIDLPIAECGAGFTTGEYIYIKTIQPRLPHVPFAIFSAALIGLDVIKAAKERLSVYPMFRGYFAKGCQNDDILTAISK